MSQAAADTLPRNVEFLVRETYNWFSHSSERQSSYAQLYSLINDGHNPSKIVRACETRWLSIYTAVERLCSQWLELKSHFQVARLKDKCYNAELLFQMYCDEANLTYLLFLKSILSDVSRVNKSFESNEADSTKLLEDLHNLLHSLFRMMVLPSYCMKFDEMMACKIEDFICPKPYLGYEVESKMDELRKEEQDLVRSRCVGFLTALFKQIRQRMPDNINILKKMSLFAIENALKLINKSSLVELLKGLKKYSDESITQIETQWQNLTLVKWEAKTTAEFWSEVGLYRDSCGANPFQELCVAALSVLSLPHSNAEIERVFSQMNLVKTKQRNKMQVQMMNNILTIRAGLRRLRKECHNYELPNDVLNIIGTKASYDTPQSMDECPIDSEVESMFLFFE